MEGVGGGGGLYEGFDEGKGKERKKEEMNREFYEGGICLVTLTAHTNFFFPSRSNFLIPVPSPLPSPLSLPR